MQIDVELARLLLGAQFPQWAGLPVVEVAEQGWDNRTFRLGETMKVRLPSASGYTAQAEKEARWLPKLAPHLPVAVPDVIAVGAPSDIYPWPWTVQTWLDGTPLPARGHLDSVKLARGVAAFLAALRNIDSVGGPAAGAHSFHRGGNLAVYDAEARGAIAALGDVIDAVRAAEIWNAARASAWEGAPVWVHGDMAAGNLLVRDERLCGVIDFGCMAVGDPACDLAPAWTLFVGAAREAFRRDVQLDEATWARARGWVLWKAAITLAANRQNEAARRVIADMLAG